MPGDELVAAEDDLADELEQFVEHFDADADR